ncbi:methyltransferase domain-containing protein [Kribbella sp. NPDC054772]
MPVDTHPESRTLRERLADQLAGSGDLRTAGWRAAVEAVPREVFVREYFRHSARPDGVPLWEPVTLDLAAVSETSLLEVYADESLVTQVDGAVRPADVSSPLTGMPTSSATMPSLVVRMWEWLLVEDTSTVAEVGTGSGYSTALACERLTSERVTSMDVAETVVGAARTALTDAGYSPRLAVGDALDGLPTPPPGGYDRVIAACSLRRLPECWIEATRPGGQILLTLTGWLHASALARLQTTGPSSAEGRLLDDPASFMPARREVAPGLTDIRTGGSDEHRSTTSLSPAILDEAMGRFLGQLAVPNVQHARSAAGREPVDYLVDVTTESYATVAADGSVVQGGPIRIWDAVEASVRSWRDAGSPGISEFTVVVDPAGQYVGTKAEPRRWRLPGPVAGADGPHRRGRPSGR